MALDNFTVTKKSVTKIQKDLYNITVTFVAEEASVTKINTDVSAEYSAGQAFDDQWKDKIMDKVGKLIDDWDDSNDIFDDTNLDDAISDINTELNA